ncbi:MAG: 30S ribosome-binding factor RbfA [Oscillospiraceae bacterium]|jgi:ribosome-binding factor A|nr:30S ribosome-binding factor RbfA [Oscillospiraceae bacterium]
MKRRRPEIVGDEMQKVISSIISMRLKDPRVPFMTSVTGVKMSSDLTHATVFISVYGDEKTKKDAMDALEHAKGFIRYEAVQEIKLRVAPELHFKLDNTLDEAARMDALIEKTIAEDERRRAEREKREAGDGKSEGDAGNDND